MFKLTHKNQNIQCFYVNDCVLYYSDHLYYDNQKILNEEVIGGSILGNKYFIGNTENEQLIIDRNLKIIQKFPNNILFTDLDLDKPFHKICSIDTNFKEDGTIECYWVILDFLKNQIIKDLNIKTNYCIPVWLNHNYILFQEENKLILYNIEKGIKIRDFIDDQFKSIVLGVFNDTIILPTKTNAIVTINLHTGKLINTWREIPGININSQIEGIIPNTESFVLDKEQSKLIGAFHKYYLEIDLKSNEISYVDVSDELSKYDIIFIKQSNDIPFTEDHLYLTAMIEQYENDTKFTYDCLFLLNRNTLKIDWIYKFKEASLGTHKPKLAGNKLYQLDNNNTLHVFEKLIK